MGGMTGSKHIFISYFLYCLNSQRSVLDTSCIVWLSCPSKVSWIFLCASFIDNILRFNVIENLRFLILSFAISLQELGMQSIDVYKHYEMKVSSKL